MKFSMAYRYDLANQGDPIQLSYNIPYPISSWDIFGMLGQIPNEKHHNFRISVNMTSQKINIITDWNMKAHILNGQLIIFLPTAQMAIQYDTQLYVLGGSK